MLRLERRPIARHDHRPMAGAHHGGSRRYPCSHIQLPARVVALAVTASWRSPRCRLLVRRSSIKVSGRLGAGLVGHGRRRRRLLTIENPGSAADARVGAIQPGAKTVDVHETVQMAPRPGASATAA